jgi:hypothetical protein
MIALSGSGLAWNAASSRAGMMTESDPSMDAFELIVAEVGEVVRSFSGDICLGHQVMWILIVSNCRSQQ